MGISLAYFSVYRDYISDAEGFLLLKSELGSVFNLQCHQFTDDFTEE